MPYGFSYSSMAPASTHALERERTAKKAFMEAKERFETDEKAQLQPGEKRALLLLTPEIHLTSVTFSTFNKWVKTHEGWRAQRKQASEVEAKLHRAYHSGKAYFINVIYEAHCPLKAKRLLVAAEKRAAKKAKGVARRNPWTILDKLIPDLQTKVLTYVSTVPYLKVLLNNTPFAKVAARDQFWKGRLRTLLTEKFDGAFCLRGQAVVVQKISERPLESTQFRAWYNESEGQVDPDGDEREDCVRFHTVSKANEYDRAKSDPNAHDEKPPVSIRWLLHDVPLHEYYLRAKKFADDGEWESREQSCEGSNRCVYCLHKWHSCEC